MNKRALHLIKSSAIILMIFLVVIQIFTTLLWFVGVPITVFHLPIEFLVTCMLFTGYKMLRGDRKNKKQILKKLLLPIILAAIVFSISTFCATYFYDTTSDGNTYHKVAIGSMINGWIPIYESSKEYTEDKGNVVTIQDGNRNYLWVDHYASGTEIIAANIYKFTNHIESGKAFNMVIIYIGLGILLSILTKGTKLGKVQSAIVATILVINPITITQIWTYYVDTMLLVSLFIVLAELISISKKKSFEKYLILFLSIILCVESKFTGAVYIAVFCFAFLVYWTIKNWKNKDYRSIRLNLIFYISLIITSVLIIGFSTYFLNFIKHGSFFYPLRGENHVENMVKREIPESLARKPNFVQFLISVFSKGENISPAYSEILNEPDLKLPFTIGAEELKNYTIPDIRVGGFGPLFSGIYIIGSLMGICIIYKIKKEKKLKKYIPFCIITGISYALLILLDGGYWARYVPYIYFTQIMNLIYFVEMFKNNRTNFISWFMLTVLCVNTWLICNVSIEANLDSSKYIRKSMIEFSAYAKSNNDVEIKLNEKTYLGVQYNLDDIGIRVKLSNKEEKKEKNGLLFTY